MNKDELIQEHASKTGFSKSDSRKSIDTLLDIIKNDLADGGATRLLGFGAFSVVRRQATTGRNPRTNEEIIIAASNKVKFKPGKALSDAVNS